MVKLFERAQQNISHQKLLLAVAGALVLLYAGTLYVMARQQTSPTKVSNASEVGRNLLGEQWSYLPGATHQNNNLTIQPSRLAIVEQDGSDGQPSPPINLFGTYLEHTGNFGVNATVANMRGEAALQLYDQPPIIADEFRIERKSVRVVLHQSELHVSIWDGSKQEPVIVRSWPSKIRPTNNLAIRYDGKQLTLSVNDHEFEALDINNLFGSKKIWFGFDATDNWTLARLSAYPLDRGRVKAIDSSKMRVIEKYPDGLQRLAAKARDGFNIGAAVALGPAVSDPGYAKLAFGGNFGSLTPENALKWQFVHPQPNTYTFQEGDALVALAQAHGMSMHGHTLVFGEANPRWVRDLPTTTPADKEKVKQIMADHISTVVEHYKGKVASWDVVNEPLADYDNFNPDDNHTLRRHTWYQAMGESYIAAAFHAARKADPDTKLFINEYGLEEDGERWDAFLSLMKELKSQGVPIDGVGFQAHVYEPADHINPAVLRRHIQELGKLGLVSRISEIDVYGYEGSNIQAQQYTNVLKVCLSELSCVSYTTWGISDRYNAYKEDNGKIAYGQDFLWSKDLQATPAVAALQSALKQQPKN